MLGKKEATSKTALGSTKTWKQSEYIKYHHKFLLFICLIGLSNTACLSPIQTPASGDSNETPSIVLNKQIIFFDEAIQIRLVGFAPNKQVTVNAELKDDAGTLWKSQASYITNDNGIADLSVVPPSSGNYRSIDPNGLLWSMKPLGYKNPLSFLTKATNPQHMLGIPHFKTDREHRVLFSATVDGIPVATTTLTRIRFPDSVSIREIKHEILRGQLFVPKTQKPTACILLISGSSGGIQRVKAALLAAKGFCVLALAYFNYADLPSNQAHVPLEYFHEALLWLKSEFKEIKIAILGGSKGGEASLLLSSTFPEFISATAAIVPAHMVVATLDQEGALVSSWTHNGEPFPSAGERPARLSGSENETPLQEPINTANMMLPLFNSDDLAVTAGIAVEKIKSPILIITGTDDQMWPSPIAAKKILSRLSHHDFSQPVTNLQFGGAGHIFMVPGWPTSLNTVIKHPVLNLLITSGGDPETNATSQRQAWQAIIDFFRLNLASQDK